MYDIPVLFVSIKPSFPGEEEQKQMITLGWRRGTEADDNP
jgi:hypothetical protein